MNIGNSENQSFLTAYHHYHRSFYRRKYSPELKVLPLDYGACGQIFVHNPGCLRSLMATSLVFKFITPQRNLPSGTIDLPRPGDVAGYRVLNDPSFGCPAVPNPPWRPSTLNHRPQYRPDDLECALLEGRL